MPVWLSRQEEVLTVGFNEPGLLGIVFNSDNRRMFGYYHGSYQQYFPGTARTQEA